MRMSINERKKSLTLFYRTLLLSLFILFLLIFLCSCNKKETVSNDFSTEEISSDQAASLSLAMTVTYAGAAKGEFNTDVRVLDENSGEVTTLATVPYTSQYPLTLFSGEDNAVYYTADAPDHHGDEVYKYDCASKESTQLTNDFFAINYLLRTQKGLFIGGVHRGNYQNVQPFEFIFKNKTLIDLSWKQDFFLYSAQKNAEDSVIYIAGFSEKAREKVRDKKIDGIKNQIFQYDTKTMNRIKVLKKEKCYIDTMAADSSILIYRCCDRTFDSVNTIYQRDLLTNREQVLTLNVNGYIREFLGLRNNQLYYKQTLFDENNKDYSRIGKIDISSQENTILYETDPGEAVNNAQLSYR